MLPMQNTSLHPCLLHSSSLHPYLYLHLYLYLYLSFFFSLPLSLSLSLDFCRCWLPSLSIGAEFSKQIEHGMEPGGTGI